MVVRVNITIDERLLNAIDAKVKKEGRSRSDFFRHAVEEYFASRRLRSAGGGRWKRPWRSRIASGLRRNLGMLSASCDGIGPLAADGCCSGMSAGDSGPTVLSENPPSRLRDPPPKLASDRENVNSTVTADNSDPGW